MRTWEDIRPSSVACLRCLLRFLSLCSDELLVFVCNEHWTGLKLDTELQLGLRFLLGALPPPIAPAPLLAPPVSPSSIEPPFFEPDDIDWALITVREFLSPLLPSRPMSVRWILARSDGICCGGGVSTISPSSGVGGLGGCEIAKLEDGLCLEDGLVSGNSVRRLSSCPLANSNICEDILLRSILHIRLGTPFTWMSAGDERRSTLLPPLDVREDGLL